jgi:hypothetical protein
MSEPNASGSLLLRRVVSRSEEDRDVPQQQEPLRMTVSSDEHEGGNNDRGPSFSSAMGTETSAAAAATAAAATQRAVWIEPNPGADTMIMMPPHNGGDNNNDPRTSMVAAAAAAAGVFGGGGGAVVGTSSSAQALHLTDDSVKVPTKAVVFATTIPSAHLHHHHHAAARERDMSSSSLSDDAEDDDDGGCDHAKDPSRGGLLRFVTAMVGASKNANNNSKTNPRDVVPRSTPAQRSSADLDDEDGVARMRGEADQDYGHDGGGAAAAAEEVSSSAGEEESTMERTGSQNSSRDWGWFEDVHMSLNEVTAGGLGLLPPPSKSNKKSGAAAASAAAIGDAYGANALADPQGRRQQQQQQQQESNRPNNSNNHQQQKPPKKKRGLIPQVSSGLQDYAAAVKSQDTTGASHSARVFGTALFTFIRARC